MAQSKHTPYEQLAAQCYEMLDLINAALKDGLTDTIRGRMRDLLIRVKRRI